MSDPHTDPHVTPGRDPLAAQPPTQPGAQAPVQPYPGMPAYGNTPAAPGGRRALSAVLGLVLGLALFVVAGLMSGAAALRTARFDLSLATAAPVFGFSLLALALVAGLAVTARSSSAGLHVAGTLHLFLGIAGVAAPQVMFPLLAPLRRVTIGIEYFALGSAPILLGATFIALGIVVSATRRKATAGSSVPTDPR